MLKPQMPLPLSSDSPGAIGNNGRILILKLDVVSVAKDGTIGSALSPNNSNVYFLIVYSPEPESKAVEDVNVYAIVTNGESAWGVKQIPEELILHPEHVAMIQNLSPGEIPLLSKVDIATIMEATNDPDMSTIEGNTTWVLSRPEQ